MQKSLDAVSIIVAPTVITWGTPASKQIMFASGLRRKPVCLHWIGETSSDAFTRDKAITWFWTGTQFTLWHSNKKYFYIVLFVSLFSQT